MFMVASSVVTTIMILNYHHRLADTHRMPNWVVSMVMIVMIRDEVEDADRVGGDSDFENYNDKNDRRNSGGTLRQKKT